MPITFVDVAGTRMRVSTRGSGPPLLLITGLGANIEMWGPFSKLVRGRTIISYDAPGMGQSDALRRPTRLGGLANVAHELLRAIGYERADVLGYSLGGGVAQEMARRFPDAVDRLVLAGTSPGLGGLPPLNPLVTAVLMTPYRYYAPGHYKRVAPLVAGGRTARDPAILEKQIAARTASPPSWTGYAHQVLAASGTAPSCSPAATTRSCRSSTPGCWRGGSPTPSSTSSRAPATSSSSTSPSGRSSRSRRFSTALDIAAQVGTMRPIERPLG
jgi:poly(3-hydroxyoctanoate) depolymerase